MFGDVRGCSEKFGASMRPRLLHLGSARQVLHHGNTLTRFNEAEAFTPRIIILRGLPIEVRAGFNEAEAFTPRIELVLDAHKRAGRSFNEAEAFTPRIVAKASGCSTESFRLQ